MNDQRKLDFNHIPGGDSEAKRERCQRLLASLGDKRIVRASEVPYFTPKAQREAERRCRAANQRTK